MATHQLGPETPRPFSVLSEGFVQQSLALPKIADDERFSFGPEYNTKMCSLFDKHLELNTNDTLCYVGDPKGSFAPDLQTRFCLLTPVVSVVPGHIHWEDSPGNHRLPFRVANVGAPEFFRQEATVGAQFDKVLLMTSLQFLQESRTTFGHIRATLRPGGKFLIVHRAAPMCTLPVFSELRERLLQHDMMYEKMIAELQSVGFDVQWEVECIPVCMAKLKWMTMIHDRFPEDLQSISTREVIAGLRELSEGVMKYSGEVVEFPDRLMFITASLPVIDKCPIVTRKVTQSRISDIQHNAGKSANTPLHYQLAITSEIQKLVDENQRAKEARIYEKRSKTLSSLLP